MDVKIQPKLKLHGVDFVDLNFKTSNQYDGKSIININIDPKVFYPKNDALTFRIIMDVVLECEDVFTLKLVAIGNFELDKEISDGLKKSFINVNAPAIMFPYVRAFISTLTSNLGNVTGHLLIPSQFFKGELKEL